MREWFNKLQIMNFINYLTLMKKFSDILISCRNIDYGRQLNPVDALFTYRIMLGRNPNLTNELPKMLSSKQTFREFQDILLNSPDFRGFFPPNKELMAEHKEGFRFWFNTSDREMGVLMAMGLYEPESVELLKKIVNPGMRCLDIGAQSGYYTCLMALIVGDGGKVYSFEPMPSNYKILLKNINENKYQNRVQPFHLACSNEEKTIDASKVSNMYVIGNVEGAEKVSVKTTRVDNIIKDRIDVIKIDIEGHEPAAIEGMKSLIQRDKPIILSEINEYWLRTYGNSNANKYVGLLISLGYEVFNVEDIKKPIAANSLNLDILGKIDIIAYPMK